MRRSRLGVWLVAWLVSGCAPGPADPLPACEWCGATEAPLGLTSVMRIASEDEPGERLVLTGRVYEADGETPAAGVVMYAYHTDATGVYRKDGDETGNGLRHGALRGWLVTDEEGRYRVETIRPGRYPSRSEPAHVHVTMLAEGGEEFWVPSTLFAGDDLITAEEIEASEAAGRFAFVIGLERDEEGIWRGERDLRMKQ